MGAGTIDLRLGRWQDVLADVEEVDAVITDPPFSSRVHQGQRTGSSPLGGGGRKTTLTYDGITEADTMEFAESWAPRTRHWVVTFCDHLAARWWETSWGAQGWYVFAPVIWLRTCPTPRLAGDGPTSAADYLTVARPRHRLDSDRAGHRRGYYLIPGNDGRENNHPGSKPVSGMRVIVSDYTNKGDTIADPFSGSGSTLLAAAELGRNSIGAEMDPETFRKAQLRIKRGFTPDMFEAS